MTKDFIILQKKLLLIQILMILISLPLEAAITRVVVTKTEPYLDGRTFGNTGSYLRITGQFYGEVDPSDPLNSVIQDIGLAPVNEKGMVEYVSDFVILRPADMEKCNGLLFLSLPNRGNIFPADSVLLFQRLHLPVVCLAGRCPERRKPPDNESALCLRGWRRDSRVTQDRIPGKYRSKDP